MVSVISVYDAIKKYEYKYSCCVTGGGHYYILLHKIPGC